MAWNSRQKSGSSGSSSRRTARNADGGSYSRSDLRARQRSQRSAAQRMGQDPLSGTTVSSRRVGDISLEARSQRRRDARRDARRQSGGGKGPVIALIAIIVAGILAVAGSFLYFSDAFLITEIKVEGVEHLTTAEMAELAGVPENTTLLRVDTSTIKKRVRVDAWVKDVEVRRDFPNTLVLVVTERTVAATVDVLSSNGKTTKKWAISSDGVWLMPIPEKGSEAAQTISQKIYEDAETALKIIDVPYTTEAEIGKECTDSNVNNALAVVSGMTTSLADQVKTVSAHDAASTTLILENGVEIAFGTATDIRTKERVCLQLMQQYEGIAYINVRDVRNPTWRSV